MVTLTRFDALDGWEYAEDACSQPCGDGRMRMTKALMPSRTSTSANSAERRSRSHLTGKPRFDGAHRRRRKSIR